MKKIQVKMCNFSWSVVLKNRRWEQSHSGILEAIKNISLGSQSGSTLSRMFAVPASLWINLNTVYSFLSTFSSDH